jgi:2-oxoglutarate dehydrogenase E2 component (dihydrolipoamide succinyltransferase)
MSVSVSMPQLGESVTEGTVTRWLKKEGERVEADEPLLEVSTDKVDTEIPSPVSGILRGITVAEDETVAVGAELAVIDETGDGAGPAAEAAPAQAPTPEAAPAQAPAAEPEYQAPAAQEYQQAAPPAQEYQAPAAQEYQQAAAPAQEYQAPAAQEYQAPAQEYQQAAPTQEYQQAAPPGTGPAPGYEPAGQPDVSSVFTPAAPAEQAPAAPPAEQAPAAPAEQAPAAPVADAVPAAPPPQVPPAQPAPPAPEPAAPPAAAAAPPAPEPAAPPAAAAAPAAAPAPAADAQPTAIPLPSAADGPYVTPLVRKLAAEHGVDLAAVTGTGVGGRIRKQDVLEAARAVRESAPAPSPAAPAAATPAAAAPAANGSAAPAPAAAAPAAPAPTAAAPAAPAAAARPVVPSTLRGTTERMSRARQVIARRMVESLQTSAQLTTVVEADVTAIARLRDRAKADFEAREGVKLSFLPFFALATVEALKVHPRLNASIDAEAGQVIYHDDEHLGIAVDTERGLMVPVIQNAGDLNIGGLARKIADLAARTRGGQVSPDDLAGGTFTLTNTGSRGALFDTPIINQPQVAILGTGSVVKRAVVVEDPQLGEVITVRSMVYLALTYDHRLVDGADAARFLTTVKDRLEEGAFEAELGL